MKVTSCFALSIFLATLVAPGANAQWSGNGEESLGHPGKHCKRVKPRFDKLFKAPVDECFNGVGEPYPELVDGVCSAGEPKRNGAQIWGMAESPRFLYWGTGANVPCTAQASPNAVLTPIFAPNQGWVCEFAEGILAQENPNLKNLGDWRAPMAYRMDTCTLEVTEITPTYDPLLQDTLGFRSGGYADDVVFLAGPGGVQEGIAGEGGGNSIIMMAWQASTGRYLGSKQFPQYSNIRKFLNHEGVLYTGVAVQESLGGTGEVLRWMGNIHHPFRFEVVGTMQSTPANFTVHDGRLFFSTWPTGDAQTGQIRAYSGIVMSPKIPEGGFLPENAKEWKEVWNITEYEPDLVSASAYAGGDITSWRGKLYWGTINFPLGGFRAHVLAYGETWNNPIGELETIIATHRATTVFRGDRFGKKKRKPKIEVLYGYKDVQVWDPDSNMFVDKNTLAGLPQLGRAGLGWPFNVYTWRLGVTGSDMYLGTLDVSRQFAGLIESGTDPANELPAELLMFLEDALSNPKTSGGKLYRFFSPNHRAIPATFNGVGNSGNFGFRTMINHPRFMWLGTANPFNLDPRGGWELYRFAPIAPGKPKWVNDTELNQ
ncbi:hypothetical protein ACJJIG_00005 [Microbulbifer sp. SSSA007]|uniref:hypothetical protein n=1 Tax=Microbulbifer sp. SSSA007 TaxID=3243379 RepID=UPI0040397C8F